MGSWSRSTPKLEQQPWHILRRPGKKLAGLAGRWGRCAKAAIRKIPRRPGGHIPILYYTPRDQLRVGLTFEDHPDRLVS
jgi:hypothetical protein